MNANYIPQHYPQLYPVQNRLEVPSESITIPQHGVGSSLFGARFNGLPAFYNGSTHGAWMPTVSTHSQLMNISGTTGMGPKGAPGHYSASGPPPNRATLVANAGNLSKIGSGDDLKVVVKALRSGLTDHKTHRQILEEMDGIHGFNAASWKDYYLNNHLLIDAKACPEHITSDTETGPNVNMLKELEEVASEIPVKLGFVEGESMSDRPNGSSLSKVTHAVRTVDNTFVANSDDISCPSCPPTPPTTTIRKSGGQFAYTQEDKVWFVKTLKYMLKYRPDMTSTDILKHLGDNASHHSADSWGWHWRRSKDNLPKELQHDHYTTATLIYKAAPDSSLSPNSETHNKPFANDKRGSPKTRATRIPRHPLDADDEGPLPGEKVYLDSSDEEDKTMGVAGGPIMHGDKRKMAHHLIAVTEGGVRPSQKDTWAKFAECHPQRSCKAWAQSYRNHYSEINKLVDMYKKRGELRRKAKRKKLDNAGVRCSSNSRTSKDIGSSVLGKRKAIS